MIRCNFGDHDPVRTTFKINIYVDTYYSVSVTQRKIDDSISCWPWSSLLLDSTILLHYLISLDHPSICKLQRITSCIELGCL